MKKNVFSITMFLFIAAMLFGSCTAKAQNASPSEIAKAFEEAGIPLLRQTVSIRDFSLSTLDGEARSLSALKGKVVFLNFWATWCGPCRAEMPSMEVLYNRFKDRGLEMLAVNCRENWSEVVVFMGEYQLTFPALLDMDGKVSTSYGIQAIPTTFIIDRDGKIIVRLVGSIDWDTAKIHAAMERLLDS
ncbi:MAG: TlpA family protein disulfide reductase [Treponema sp.]|jgi:thiol-disulfide isomerase/thioredoxin|nr:TlpA family protein disulfide reductase [Treponema sp.]